MSQKSVAFPNWGGPAESRACMQALIDHSAINLIGLPCHALRQVSVEGSQRVPNASPWQTPHS